MVRTAAVGTSPFPIEQYNQQDIAYAVFPDIIHGHEYPVVNDVELDPDGDMPDDDIDGNQKVNKKRRGASTVSASKKSPNPIKKDSKYYGEIIKNLADSGACDDELPFDERSLNSSYDNALNQIINTLSTYYKYPTFKIGSKRNVSAHRAYQKKYNNMTSFAKGCKGLQYSEKKNYVYCGTCMKNSLHPHDFHYVIIATVDLCKPVKIIDGHFQARVKVQELFPHNCGCTTPTYLQEYSRVVGLGAGGSGSDLILDFPQEEIIRYTFDPVLLKLKKSG